MSDLDQGELLELHNRLIAGDRTASAVLAQKLLPAVWSRLSRLRKRIRDAHIVESAMDLSIASYLRDPARYDPGRSPLVWFLAMDVAGDVKNELRRMRREVPASDSVELSRARGNDDVEDTVLDAVDPFDLPRAIVAKARDALDGFDEQDRSILGLLSDGVRSTAAYAEILGITHLPLAAQRATVKKHKGRISKRLERFREQFK
jgi:RNA polymerase sigma-70 factor (ECF subfamily)